MSSSSFFRYVFRFFVLEFFRFFFFVLCFFFSFLYFFGFFFKSVENASKDCLELNAWIQMPWTNKQGNGNCIVNGPNKILRIHASNLLYLLRFSLTAFPSPSFLIFCCSYSSSLDFGFFCLLDSFFYYFSFTFFFSFISAGSAVISSSV